MSTWITTKGTTEEKVEIIFNSKAFWISWGTTLGNIVWDSVQKVSYTQLQRPCVYPVMSEKMTADQHENDYQIYKYNQRVHGKECISFKGPCAYHPDTNYKAHKNHKKGKDCDTVYTHYSTKDNLIKYLEAAKSRAQVQVQN